MKRKSAPRTAFRDDPVTAAVRRARAKVLKQAGGTLQALGKSLEEEQNRLEAAGKIVMRRTPAQRARLRRKKAA